MRLNARREENTDRPVGFLRSLGLLREVAALFVSARSNEQRGLGFGRSARDALASESVEWTLGVLRMATARHGSRLNGRKSPVHLSLGAKGSVGRGRELGASSSGFDHEHLCLYVMYRCRKPFGRRS